jgi:hypothetical protein
VAIPFNLIAQRPDHLRMAEIAALADVNVAASQLQRRIGPDAVNYFDRALQIKQRRNLDEAADRDDRENLDHKEDRVLFEDLVPGPE